MYNFNNFSFLGQLRLNLFRLENSNPIQAQKYPSGFIPLSAPPLFAPWWKHLYNWNLYFTLAQILHGTPIAHPELILTDWAPLSSCGVIPLFGQQCIFQSPHSDCSQTSPILWYLRWEKILRSNTPSTTTLYGLGVGVWSYHYIPPHQAWGQEKWIEMGLNRQGFGMDGWFIVGTDSLPKFDIVPCWISQIIAVLQQQLVP